MSWPTKADAPPAMSCGRPNSAWLKIAAIKMIPSRLIFVARASRPLIHAQDARATDKLKNCFFVLCVPDRNCFSLVERGGSMRLRRGPLVQVLETQDRQQYNERERVGGDMETEFNQAVYRDAADPND